MSSIVVFTVPKVLCALPKQSISHPQLLTMTALFAISIVLPSSEHHIVEIRPYITFVHWLPVLSSKHLRFLCVRASIAV